MHTPVSRVLAVEDSTGGVESGARAGCLTLALGTSHAREVMMSPDLSYAPDMFAQSFADIKLAV
jgi:beta-phosphoglucomutase-like phosphatase (HAD superfamily)